MKAIILAPLLLLASCAGLGSLLTPPASPAAVANTTTLDEQAALGVELAYKAARTAVEVGVDAGLIKGTRATQFAELDNKAFNAVVIVRRAYRAGNATDYATGLSQARLAVADLLSLVS
jgi:hypothetical protein